jgi:hypothetical protein
VKAISPTLAGCGLLILMTLSSWGAYASDCSTVKEMDTADAAASKIDNWTGVHSFYSNFRQCDYGYIAEGTSDTIVKLLAYKWEDTRQLEKLTERDKDFEVWMLKHINSTVNSNDLDLIIKNSKNECPTDGNKFCKRIENAANQALQDMKE